MSQGPALPPGAVRPSVPHAPHRLAPVHHLRGVRGDAQARPWRAFFVTRDPRDMVVSWYFSTVASHPTGNNPGMQRTRDHLAALDRGTGARLQHRLPRRLRPVRGARELGAGRRPAVLVVRYEDLIGASAEAGGADSSTTATSRCTRTGAGRCSSATASARCRDATPGNEDTGSKLRKGVAGDWRNHFTSEVREAFDRRASDVVDRLGYGERPASAGARPQALLRKPRRTSPRTSSTRARAASSRATPPLTG